MKGLREKEKGRGLRDEELADELRREKDTFKAGGRAQNQGQEKKELRRAETARCTPRLGPRLVKGPRAKQCSGRWGKEKLEFLKFCWNQKDLLGVEG